MHPTQAERQVGALTWALALMLVMAGCLQAVSLAWPFDGEMQGRAQGWLQCLSMLAVAWHLDRSCNNKQAFLITWLFAFAWLLGCIWWLYISMHRYGGLSAILAAMAVVSLAAGLALIYGLAGVLYVRVCQQGVGLMARASAFACVWMLAEMVRGTLWTGFPWGAVGYAHVDGVLRHWAPWIGVYGLCGISAFIAMVIACRKDVQISKSWKAQVVTFIVLISLSCAWLASPTHDDQRETFSSRPFSVTLLQGNIAQDLKFGEGVSQALNSYRTALLLSTSDLTVTPETALPLIQQQIPDRYWHELESHYSKGQQAALIGMPAAMRTTQGQLQYSNSAVALMPQATPASTASYQYDKHHLVPFGEFVPPLFQWFVRMMNIPLGDFTRGDVAQPSFVFKGERIAPNICYEDLFGEELARSFADPDKAPTMMVNLSNIAWFGDTVAIDQHLHISRMRALELGRPMLRATNTGATAIINAKGEVTHRLPSAVQGALTAEVHGVHGPVTPYARWVSEWGLWPLAGLALFTLLIVAAQSHAARHGQRRFGP